MAGPNFRTTRRHLGPTWLLDGEGGLVGYALDLVKDAFMRRLELGHLARFPENGPNGETAPPDALAALGRDRRVVRGFNEPDAAYAKRLTRWLDDRKTAGNSFALMQKVAEYLTAGTGEGIMLRTVDARGNWYTRDAMGARSHVLKTGNWNWNGQPAGQRWARFWLIIYPPPSLWTPSLFDWGDEDGPSWGHSDGTWGSTAIAEQIVSIRALVSDWKPAHARCVNIIVAFDPASFDPSSPEPDGLWERPWKDVDGIAYPSRLATARYWEGVT